MDPVESGLIRALCFFDACDYPPTRAELFCHWDGKKDQDAGLEDGFERLVLQGVVKELRGRVVFSEREALIREHETREALFPRKIRRARAVVRWLRRLSGVRFVALCNTTALAHARDGGDLDFFVVTRTGTLWQTRAWSTLPFKLLHQRPSGGNERDAVCLSFFVDDRVLDLSSLQLAPDDVYFRHWFLSLLPLYDDGISRALWEANAPLRSRHPHARPWLLNGDIALRPSIVRLPLFGFLEKGVRWMQEKRFPAPIRSLMNQDTRVVVNDHVLKFHVEDGREHWRRLYQERCQRYGVA